MAGELHSQASHSQLLLAQKFRPAPANVVHVEWVARLLDMVFGRDQRDWGNKRLLQNLSESVSRSLPLIEEDSVKEEIAGL
ncbi:uncharacterized protein Z520_02339 [Fonsecaea multimorphosa CBS 102226]|uniref:Uncharacterized protein n=1 Tax=Fonsecaea multimorphosa CBS 102226 TaxID=1442371 RepID=A0A0D2HJW6_9EURO|nr:uncharacterized protein Z520_02339 [Fonsecaea multimorphosa CBS 102226]KIY02201.1 hypothetical protein Z520_02339 [Fonsecaea multimorphosa CBS 102226]